MAFQSSAHHSTDEPDDAPGSVREVLVTVAAALLLAWFVQAYLVKPFRIPSGSMENTLRCNDRVLVDRLGYRFSQPHRGDVVVFHPPAAVIDGKVDTREVAGDGSDRPHGPGARTVTAADINYIKRIVGMPGDVIEVKRHHAYVNGKRLSEPYLHPLPSGFGIDSLGTMVRVTVPEHTYLMLGDHRDNSSDGRVFGFVPRSFIVGKAFMVYWPPQRFGGLPDRDPGGKAAAAPDRACQEAGAVSGSV